MVVRIAWNVTNGSIQIPIVETIGENNSIMRKLQSIDKFDFLKPLTIPLIRTMLQINGKNTIVKTFDKPL